MNADLDALIRKAKAIETRQLACPFHEFREDGSSQITEYHPLGFPIVSHHYDHKTGKITTEPLPRSLVCIHCGMRVAPSNVPEFSKVIVDGYTA